MENCCAKTVQNFCALSFVATLPGTSAFGGFENKGWQAKDVCWFCNAKNQGNACLYTEIGEDADWVGTIVDNTWEWARSTLPQHNLCPLLALPGFHVHTVRLCSMHNVNLGLLQVCNGSALILWKG